MEISKIYIFCYLIVLISAINLVLITYMLLVLIGNKIEVLKSIKGVSYK